MTPISRYACFGFTYIGLLLAVALVGAGLAAIGQVWHTNVQRSREAELQFIGEQFKRAIKLYYDSTPGGDKQLPKSLEDLLRDRRYPVVRRYLRKVYADPMRGKAEWGLIKPNNGEGIVGVYSLSEGEPFKRRDSDGVRTATPKTLVKYADWRFVADISFAPDQAVTMEPSAPGRGAQPLQPILPPLAPETAAITVPNQTPPPRVARVPRNSEPTDPCQRMRETDSAGCTSNSTRLGYTDHECVSSAALRYSNCIAGLAPGPLWTIQ